jgi:hypothetical protein
LSFKGLAFWRNGGVALGKNLVSENKKLLFEKTQNASRQTSQTAKPVELNIRIYNIFKIRINN